jgi:DNA-binding NarL/FixJ family response regulator
MIGSRTRVFLVDDHPLVREWLANLLRHQPDLEVVGQAEDAVQAIAAMSAAPPDVAIVDLTLKSGSGIDLIKDLRDRVPETQAIVLSMREEVFDVERAFRAGARGYVMKGESTERIVDAIRQVRAGKVYANPDILARLAERMIGRGPAAANPADSLSDRELDVFRRLGEGHNTRRIATDLRVSIKTVQAYCGRIKEKLGFANASELVRAAVQWTEQHPQSR